MEQFSQKTNWKLAEELLFNQSCKKDLHVTRKDRKNKKGLGLGHVPQGRICLEEIIHMRGLSPLRVSRSSQDLGISVLVSCTEKSPCLLGNPLRQIKGLEKPRLYCTHAGMLTIRQRALHWWLLRFRPSQSKGANTLAPPTPNHNLTSDLGKDLV